MITRVYQYGLLRPIENSELVRNQMRACHVYRAELTDIECRKRDSLREADKKYGNEAVSALEAKISEATRAVEAAIEAISQERTRTRSRVDSDESKAAVKLARENRRALFKELLAKRRELREQLQNAKALVEKAAKDLVADAVKELEDDKTRFVDTAVLRSAVALLHAQAVKDLAAKADTLTPELQAAFAVVKARTEEQEVISAIRELAAERTRQARSRCGTYWGTYLLAETAMNQAMKVPMYDKDDPTLPNDPDFPRWSTKEGRVGVQLQRGLPSAQVFGADPRLRIDPVDEGAWLGVKRSVRKKLSRTVLRMRVDSTPKGKPVWAAWPMIMHRPIPAGAIIKEATVHLRRCGPTEEWTVSIAVNLPDPTTVARADAGAVAFDLGWRVMGDELRVAMWRAENGETGEIRLSQHLISRLTKAASLRSIRDGNFDAARAKLATWLTDRQVPAWLSEATTHLARWRSIARLSGVAMRWRKERFEGDEEAYAELERWRYHDYHLWQWETAQRTKALRRRREFYRIIAKALAVRFSTLVLESFDMREVSRRPKKGSKDDNVQNEIARSNRQMAAVSELRTVLIHAFIAQGGQMVKVSAVNSTKECSTCGSIEDFDAAADLHHTCGKCGAQWDQDKNADINLLARWREQQRAVADPSTARAEVSPNDSDVVAESKWVRARRISREKKDAKEAARKLDANSAEG